MKKRRRLNKKLVMQYIKENGLTFKEFCNDFYLRPRELRKLFRRYCVRYLFHVAFMADVMEVKRSDLIINYIC